MSWFRFIVEEGRWPAISPPKPEHTGVLIRRHRTRFQLPAYANGTGHVNIGQGEVMTVRGVGTSLSPAIGGWIAEVGLSRDISHSWKLYDRIDFDLALVLVASEASMRSQVR
jgi:hypothetical protein